MLEGFVPYDPYNTGAKRGPGGKGSNPFLYQPGTYFIHVPHSGRVYFGSAEQLGVRIRVHCSHFRNGTHLIQELQQAHDQGLKLEFYVRPMPSRDEAYALEQALIDRQVLENEPLLINEARLDVRTVRGIRYTQGPMSEEFRQKRSDYMNRQYEDPAFLATAQARMRSLVEKQMRPVVVRGMPFPSTAHAAQCFGESQGNLWVKCNNPNNPSYYFADQYPDWVGRDPRTDDDDFNTVTFF